MLHGETELRTTTLETSPSCERMALPCASISAGSSAMTLADNNTVLVVVGIMETGFASVQHAWYSSGVCYRRLAVSRQLARGGTVVCCPQGMIEMRPTHTHALAHVKKGPRTRGGNILASCDRGIWRGPPSPRAFRVCCCSSGAGIAFSSFSSALVLSGFEALAGCPKGPSPLPRTAGCVGGRA